MFFLLVSTVSDVAFLALAAFNASASLLIPFKFFVASCFCKLAVFLAFLAAFCSDTVVAFLFKPTDYILNTNLNMTIKRYEDNDTDDLVTKAIMLVDGKVVDKNSLVTITKKSA